MAVNSHLLSVSSVCFRIIRTLAPLSFPSAMPNDDGEDMLLLRGRHERLDSLWKWSTDDTDGTDYTDQQRVLRER